MATATLSIPQLSLARTQSSIQLCWSLLFKFNPAYILIYMYTHLCGPLDKVTTLRALYISVSSPMAPIAFVFGWDLEEIWLRKGEIEGKRACAYTHTHTPG